jgi:hypothetical protein
MNKVIPVIKPTIVVKESRVVKLRVILAGTARLSIQKDTSTKIAKINIPRL